MKSLEKFVVRWYVPTLNIWIDVATARSLTQAQGSEDYFRKSMRDVWVGKLQIVIVRIVEEEVSDVERRGSGPAGRE